MTSVTKSLAQLAAGLQGFSEISGELQDLRRNVLAKPVTGATLYRHCLDDLNERIRAAQSDVDSLASITVEAPSLEEIFGHCAALYTENHRAIAALETRLAQFGYLEAYAPVPPENPLELLDAARSQPSSSPITSTPSGSDSTPNELNPPLSFRKYATITTTAIASSPQQPSTTQFGVASGIKSTAAERALAPLTAAKLKAKQLTGESPSSVSSMEVLTPSMASLLGKYAASAAHYTGIKAATPLPPLSPAFAAAERHHRKQITAATGDLSLPAQEHALNALHEWNQAGISTSIGASDSTLESGQQAVPLTRRRIDEDSTMELKAQVIFNRATFLSQDKSYSTPASASITADNATNALETAALLQNAQIDGAYSGDEPSAPNDPREEVVCQSSSPSTILRSANAVLAPSSTRESLQQEIAAALGRHNNNVASSQSVGVTPANVPVQQLSTARVSATSRPSSARAISCLTPSLPTTVPPLRSIDNAEYSSLPSFIRGQISLETLNQASTSVHAAASRRCSSGGGPSFTMDDVEANGGPALPSGKGKVLVNALAKLGRVQLKVVYGQGTVYFFS